MANENKFAAVMTSLEAAEREALLELRRVEKVLEERLRALEALKQQQQKLKNEARSLAGPATCRALLRGDLAQLRTVRSFREKVGREAKAMSPEIIEREQDYDRALERMKAAEQELLATRIDRKRIEQLTSARRQRAYAQDLAREEDKLDELNAYRGQK